MSPACYIVECLSDIQEYSSCLLISFESSCDTFDYSQILQFGEVFISETELLVGYNVEVV